ncbi:hypothetical protein MNBD_NITROSPINAE04-331 [hydrothermal vent metagenome]|uniref:TMEM205-like domain-containing protein n=1 Tax=hydrothermal vent metagenome TaxID=652676 RepID=A0A3B1CR11_9ZZZZ
MIVAVKYIHLLALVIWIGSVVFFSFIGAPSIFQTVDKKTAGDIVGVIFPKYYLLGYICSLISLGALAFLGAKSGFLFPVKAGLAILAVMACITFYSGLVTAPKVNSVKYQIRGETDEAKLAPLRKQFGKLHGISMVLNLTVLLLGLALLYFTVGYMGRL